MSTGQNGREKGGKSPIACVYWTEWKRKSREESDSVCLLDRMEEKKGERVRYSVSTGQNGREKGGKSPIECVYWTDGKKGIHKRRYYWSIK